MDPDRTTETVHRRIPDMFDQFFLTDRPPLMQQQVFEDARLLARERQRLAAHGRRARLGVKRQLGAGQDHVALRKAAQCQAADARRELIEVKGLGEIVCLLYTSPSPRD